MANIPTEYDFHRDTVDKWHIMVDEHRDTPKAKAVLLVNPSGDAYDDTNKLPVEASFSGQITLGAVKLEDGASTQKASVDANGSLSTTPTDESGNAFNNSNPLPVTIGTGTPIDRYGTSMVASSATATLSTYTVPVAGTFDFNGAIINGDEYGYFEFQVNGVTRVGWRNSGSERSSIVNFPNKIVTIAGDVIDIKVTNNGNKTKDFDGTIFGNLW